jgi:hypothetical protein
MPGANLQLVAYGSQDIYLTGNPQITYFKFIYRRHTNFAMESIQIYDNPHIKMGTRATVKIPYHGELLSALMLEVEMVDKTIISTYYGYQLIDFVDLEIGSQLIDRQYGEWMAIWNDLSMPLSKLQMVDDMLAKSDEIIYIPLTFWFSKNPGLALPLIALMYNEVRLIIQLKPKNNVTGYSELSSFKVYADYIYLDTDEKKQFMSNSHQYLIEQVQQYQSPPINSNDARFDLDFHFSHPVKELIWVVYDHDHPTIYNIVNYERVKAATLLLNNQDRFSKRSGTYFTKVQRFKHHSGCGSLSALLYPHIYSFAINPEEHQPSGTCNFSRIDNAQLILELDTSTQVTGTLYRLIRLYATNYNILKVINGLGGLAYT